MCLFGGKCLFFYLFFNMKSVFIHVVPNAAVRILQKSYSLSQYADMIANGEIIVIFPYSVSPMVY